MKTFQRVCNGLGLAVLLSVGTWAAYLAAMLVIEDGRHQRASLMHTRGWFAFPVVISVLVILGAFGLAFMRHEDKE